MLEKTRLWKVLETLKSFERLDILDKVIDRGILDAMERLNREQLNEGERADGVTLPDYSETSVNVYGKPRGPIKLFDSGEFYESITTIALNNVIRFVSNPFKQDALTGEVTNLEERYGKEIIGLNEESLEKIRKDVKIKIVAYVKRVLNAS